MKIIITLSIFFLTSLTSLLYGQRPKIKKETVIIYKYNYDRLLPVDTLVNEYDIDGKLLNPKVLAQNGRSLIFRCLMKTITIDSTDIKIHRQNVYSDSSRDNIYQYNYGDSIVILQIEKNDTLFTTTELYKNNELLKTTTIGKKSYSYQYYHSLTKENINYGIERMTEITKEYDWEPPKIIRYESNKSQRTDKVYTFDSLKKEWIIIKKLKYKNTKTGKALKREVNYNYNPFIKEWYIKKKEKSISKRKFITIERFYHDYFKVYFKKRITCKINKYGYRLYEKVYDFNYRMITDEKIYIYEYY